MEVLKSDMYIQYTFILLLSFHFFFLLQRTHECENTAIANGV